MSMVYLIQCSNAGSLNRYYLSGFRDVDGIIVPTRVMRYRAKDHACHFPSIKAACAVVRLLDRSKYRLLIVPSCLVF